jgi:hypothetical protein
VLGIDFSDAALEAARRGARIPTRLACAKPTSSRRSRRRPFDLVYERAFLCALPRRLWRDWGRRIAQLVLPGGRLAGFFHFDDAERGPAFRPSRRGGARSLLVPAFERLEDQPVADSIAVFQGKERWQVWRRLQSGSNSSDCG